MAIYKRDIVDINLETGNIHRSFLNHSIGTQDQQADRFGIRVFRDGEPVNLTNVSVQGVFMPPRGAPIAITGSTYTSIAGNTAEVILPQACYNYEGTFTLAIKLVDATNAVTGTMRIVDGMVDNTHASGTVAPTSTVPTYQEVLAVYNDMVDTLDSYDEVVDEQNGKIDDLKSAFDNNYDGIETFITHGSFAVGGLNTDGTLLPSQTTRVSSANVDTIKFDRDIIVNCKNGFRWGYIPFTNGTPGSWVGWLTGSTIITSGTEFVVQISKDPEGTATANVSEYVSALTFKTRQEDINDSVEQTDNILKNRLAELDGYGQQIYIGDMARTFTSVYDYIQIKSVNVAVSSCDKFRVLAESFNSYGTRVMTINCKNSSDTTLLSYAVLHTDFADCDYECAVPDGTTKVQIIFYANYTGSPTPSVGNVAYFNGVVFLAHSAGASDQTISTLVSKMEVVEDYIDTQKSNLNAFSAKLGTLVNGVYNPATKRGYTEDYIDCTYGLNIHMTQSGLKYGIHGYNAQKVCTYSSPSWVTGDTEIANGTYAFVRINFAKSDDSDIDGEGVVASLASKITIWQNRPWETDEEIAYAYSAVGSLRTKKLMYDIKKTSLVFPAVADITAGTVTSFQGMAYCNGVVFQLYSNDVLVMVDYATGTKIAEMTIDSGHGDSIDFSNEYYNQQDEFPLAYITTDEDADEAKVNIVRISRSSATLIKTLKFPLDKTGYYAAHALDTLNNVLYEVGYTLESYWSSESGTNKMIVSAWDLSSLTANLDSTYTPAFINSFTIPFFITTQGQCFFDGKIAMVSSHYENTKTEIVFIDVGRKRVDFVIDDLPNALKNYECEGVAFAPSGNKYLMLIKPNGKDVYSADFNT